MSLTIHPAEPPSERTSPPARWRVAMALYGDLTYDSRVQREARTLAEAGYDVTVVCLMMGDRPPDFPDNLRVIVRRPPGSPVTPGSANPFFASHGRPVSRVVRPVAWLLSYVRGLRSWGKLAVAAAGPVDVWHAHDLTGLAAVVPNLPRDARIVYDSHELFLDTGTPLKLPHPARRLLGAYERRLASRACALVTVNGTLEATLRERLGLTRTVVVHNAPPRWTPPDPAPDLLRDRLGLPRDALIALYHGGLTEDRGLLPLVDAVERPEMDGIHLVFLGSGQLHDQLAERAADPRAGGRVHLLDAVPPDELAGWVASADVGLMPNQPVNANERLSTPNKLFESMAVGLPVVSSDFPERRRIILGDPDGPLGAVCDPTSPEAIAEAIRSILQRSPAERAAMRARILRAAHERWNWETESARLVALYDELATEVQATVSPGA